MKKIALVAGCLLLFACSSDDDHAGSGQGGKGGQAGSTGGGGHAGTTGGGGQTAGTTGSAGTTGGGGQTGGATGTAGTTGGGGQTAGTTGSAGHGGTTGGGGQTAGTTGSAGHGGTTGGGGQAGGSTGSAGRGGTTGGGGSSAGSGGNGGAAGQGGRGGTGGSLATCTQLGIDYATAMVRARMCNAALSVPQCTHLVLSSLSCGCQTWVNDTTEIDAIKAQWDAAGCTGGIACPLIACVNPGTHASCVPANSGDLCQGAN